MRPVYIKYNLILRLPMEQREREMIPVIKLQIKWAKGTNLKKKRNQINIPQALS